MITKTKYPSWWEIVSKNWSKIFLAGTLVVLLTGIDLGKYSVENWLAMTGIAITNTALLTDLFKKKTK
jgi:succinate dehydrogenase hydrophobic anchor subunit